MRPEERRFATSAGDMPVGSTDGTQEESTDHARSKAAPASDASDAANDSGPASRGRQTNAVERFLNWAGGAVARGARTAETADTAGITDEPLPYGTEVDWGRALDLAMRRRDSERARLDRIESKIAPIIGGTVAALALFVDKAARPADYLIGALLLVPLGMLFLAFRTFEYIDTPSLDELVRTYERWPLTYIRSVVIGTADALAINGPIIDRKARDLNRTMAVLFAVVIVVITVRAYEALDNEHQRTPVAGGHSAVTVPVVRTGHKQR